MTMLNPTLLQLARVKIASDRTTMQKSAVVPPPPPMDPAMMGGAPPGGAPPMDPAMMGGAPPMPGAAPPMDPAMMGAAPPMDPAMMGVAPPVDPAAAGGVPPAAPAAPGAPAAPVKLKPEDRINQVDFRLYNMQQQLSAIMNSMNVTLPPGALITPPGSPVPVAEAATPGGTQDPGAAAAAGGGQPDPSGISPIEGIQAFDPASGGGGGETKQAMDIASLINNIVGRGINMDITKTAEGYTDATRHTPQQAATRMQNNTAAVAAILRSRIKV